ncbi:MAG: hypothetical protein IT186_17345 [Acidobacteria bacterium]|nr:hypothetical protein [Acidobacteriota bacterium]
MRLRAVLGVTFLLLGSSLFAAETTLFVPVVLSSSGLMSSFFSTELTLTNRGASDVTLSFEYTPAPNLGGGGGTAQDRLPAGRQVTHADAIAYLRSLNPSMVPESGNRGGTLRITFSGLLSEGDAAATARTLNVNGPRSGLAYAGVRADRLLADAAHVAGLRQNGLDRSNLAFQHAGSKGSGSVTLRTTLCPGTSLGTPFVAQDVTLAPGGFHQFTEVLNLAGFSSGFALIERVAGTAPWYAYGVINDQANGDGSFIPARPRGFEDVLGELTVPALVETSTYSSEVTLANLSSSPKTLRLILSATGLQGGATGLILALEPREQRIIPDFVEYLRLAGAPGIPAKGTATIDGTLFIRVDGAAASGVTDVFAGVRVGSEGGGGRYGVFAPALSVVEASKGDTWIHALLQDSSSRSNVALLNPGHGDVTDVGLELTIFDGSTGKPVKTLDPIALAERQRTQLNQILTTHAPGVSNAYLRIRRVAGTNAYFCYGVVNDGATPGQGTSDGAHVVAHPVPTPSPALPATAGLTRQWVDYRGWARGFLLSVPPTYDGKADVPLLMGFHGGGHDYEDLLNGTGLRQAADAAGFISIYPNGTLGDAGSASFHGMNCCATALDQQVPDTAYIRFLVNHISTQFRIDPKRVYLTGMSNGGFLSHRAGAELSDIIAAIAPVAASHGGSPTASGEPILIPPAPAVPVGVMAFKGLEDTAVLYNGGSNGSRWDLSAAETMAFWTSANGCGGTALRTVLYGGEVYRDVYPGCRNGADVILYSVVHGGHEWPGRNGVPGPAGFSASDLMLDFFKTHRKP